ncbi:hypothetical protein KDL29_08245 [bacterium]|nr:hypothetical protein [bacterium]
MLAISYLDIVRLRGDLHIGGLLSVNELGIPIEFIHSEQIRPTELQTSLYGSTLGRYLLLDVIGKGLVDASQQKAAPLVVNGKDLLALGQRVKRPVCFIQRTENRPLSDSGAFEWLSETELQAQLGEHRSPILLEVFSRDNFAAEKTIPGLGECGASFDVLEPMGRIRRILDALQREQVGQGA